MPSESLLPRRNEYTRVYTTVYPRVHNCIPTCTQLYTHVYTTVYTRVHKYALSISSVGLACVSVSRG